MIPLMSLTFGALLAPVFAGDENVRLKAVTSDSIFVEAPCVVNGSCRLESVKYNIHGVSWGERAHGFDEDGIVALRKLLSNTTYDVNLQWFYLSNPERKYNSKITASTCNETIHAVTDLCAVEAGPGWIDVRWTPLPKEDCNSRIFYFVRYGMQNAMGPWKPYGVFTDGAGNEVFRPSHPCAGWPHEFCVLLTDHVEVSKKHIIEVAAARYAPGVVLRVDNFRELNHPTTITTAVTNASLTVSSTLGGCYSRASCTSAFLQVPATSVTAAGSPRGRTGVAVSVWAAVGVTAGVVAAAAAMGVTIYFARRRWHTAQSLLGNIAPEPMPPPDVCQSQPPKPLRVQPRPLLPPKKPEEPSQKCYQPRDLPDPRYVSAIYDDCEDILRPETIYERLQEPPTKPPLSTTTPLEACSPVTENTAPLKQNSSDCDTYTPMGPAPALYDDIQDVIRRSENEKQSEGFVASRILPTYIEIQEDEAQSPGYNRPYSTMNTEKWKEWS